MILDEIFARCKADLAQIKQQIPLAMIEQQAEQNAEFKPRNPQAVQNALRKNAQKLNIIAEVKKASPSKGVIRADFAPLIIATNYAQNGAAAISVLTEKHYFQGDLAYLSKISEKLQNANLQRLQGVKNAVNSQSGQALQNAKNAPNLQATQSPQRSINSQSTKDLPNAHDLKQSSQRATIPLLRKDFIFDEYQILQSLANGADFILLIAKMLEKKELLRLSEFAKSLKLEVLCEIHSEEELEKAVFAGAQIIGVNHRNLNDFSMDLRLCQRLLPLMPKDSITVAESGLEDKKTMLDLDALGVDAFLVGEHLMRQSDEGRALRNLTERT